MIDNIKVFIERHQILIAVIIIIVLFYFFIFWYFNRRDTPQKKGGAISVKINEDGSHVKITDDNYGGIGRELIGMEIDKCLQIPVLSESGVEFIKEHLSVFSSLALIHKYFATTFNLYDIIKNPVKFITGSELRGKSTIENLFIYKSEEHYPDACFKFTKSKGRILRVKTEVDKILSKAKMIKLKI